MTVTPPSTPPHIDYNNPSVFDEITDPKLQAIAWLTQVHLHASVQSDDSCSVLADCADYAPPEHLSSELEEVVTAVKNFAETRIHNPYLPELASTALRSLRSQLRSPVKVFSPSKPAPTPFDRTKPCTARRRLTYDM